MITRLLHGCGVYLGESADLLPATDSNADGYWENTKFIKINEQILNHLGGDWDCPPPLPNISAVTPSITSSIQAIVAEFEHHAVWGWKDPRNCLTLPLWQERVPHAKVVVPVRNPLEVAVSLHRAYGLSHALALTLWLEYNRRVLSHTSSGNRIVVHYDAFFHDSGRELGRLLDFLGIPRTRNEVKDSADIVRPGLRHSRYSAADFPDAKLSRPVLESYMSMCEEAEWTDGKGGQLPGNGTGRREASQATPSDDSASPGRGARQTEDRVGTGGHRGPEPRVPVGHVDMPAARSSMLQRRIKSVQDELSRCRGRNQGLRDQLAVRNDNIKTLRAVLRRRDGEIMELRNKLNEEGPQVPPRL